MLSDIHSHAKLIIDTFFETMDSTIHIGNEVGTMLNHPKTYI
jgi:hypothetical protein